MIDLGTQYTNFEFTLIRPDGRQEQFRPEIHEGISIAGRTKIPAGGETSRTLFLNEWIAIEQAGPHRLLVHFSGAVKTKSGDDIELITRSQEIPFDVVPQNAQELRSRCADLVAKIGSTKIYVEADEATRILSSIQDPIAVPYLKKATEFWHLAPITVPALGRIRNAESIDALLSFLNSTDPLAVLLSKSWLQRIERETTDTALQEKIRLALSGAR